MNDECVLCSIKIDANGAIIVKPDFSSQSYFVQTGGFAKGKLSLAKPFSSF
jgi:hypothetical protein